METTGPTARIGEILTRCGLVSGPDLTKALDYAKKEGVRLGAALVRLGLLDEDELTWALGVQFDLAYVDLKQEMIDWGYLLGFNLSELRRLKLLPMTLVEGTARAVVADPTHPDLARAAETMFQGHEAVIQLASAQDIDKLLDEAERRLRSEEQTGPVALPLDRWIAALETGHLTAAVFYPAPDGSGNYRAQAVPGSDKPEELAEGDFLEILSETIGTKVPAFESSSVRFLLKPGQLGTERRPTRALVLAGPAGRVLAHDGWSSTPPEKPSRIIALAGMQPAAIKEAFCSEAGSLFSKSAGRAQDLVVAFEARTDVIAAGIFQVEIPHAAERIEAVRRFASPFRPCLAMVEVETVADLQTIQHSLERAPIETLLVLVRQPEADSIRAWAPAPTTESFGVLTPDEWRGKIRKILGLEGN